MLVLVSRRRRARRCADARAARSSSPRARSAAGARPIADRCCRQHLDRDVAARGACPSPGRPRPSRRRRSARGSRTGRVASRGTDSRRFIGEIYLCPWPQRARATFRGPRTSSGRPSSESSTRGRAARRRGTAGRRAAGRTCCARCRCATRPWNSAFGIPASSASPRADLDRHELLVGRAVVELLAVGAPVRLGAAGGRDLPLAARPGKALDVDLGAAGLVRLVRDEAAVGRELADALVERRRRERDRLRVAGRRAATQMSQPVFVLRLVVGEVPAVRDKSVGNLSCSVFRRSFSSPWPLDGLLVEVRGAPSRSDAKTIGSPSGDQSGAKLLPGANVKRELTPRARSRIQMSVLPVRGSREVEGEAVARRGRGSGPRTRRGRRASRAPFRCDPPRAAGSRTPRCGRRASRRARRRSARGRRCRSRSARRAGPARPCVFSAFASKRLRDERLVADEEQIAGRRVGQERLGRRERPSSPSSRASRSGTRCRPASGRSPGRGSGGRPGETPASRPASPCARRPASRRRRACRPAAETRWIGSVPVPS